ncbi:hypothetical protein Aduo_013396 [Ancylostoma duodenale]
MILESVVLSLVQLSYVNTAPHSQETQNLRCIFSRASNLDDWEQLADDIAKGAVNVTLGLEPVAPVSVECADPRAHCVAIWAARGNETEMLLQGCWDVTQDVCSPPEMCSSGDRVFQPSRNGFPSYMCCCRADTCNRIDRVVIGPLDRRKNKTALNAENKRERIRKRDYRITILLWATFVASVVLLLLALRKCWSCRGKHVKHRHSADIIQAPISPRQVAAVSPTLQNHLVTSAQEPLLEEKDPFLASLQMAEQIGAGHFANIYRATSNVGDVAVKVYHKDQALFFNEYEILTILESMKHPNIVRIIRNSNPGNRLIMELCSCCLHSLLEKRSLTMGEFFDCAISINEGLSFLHSHNNNGVAKSVIAHRDLNPYNILVRNCDSPRLQLCIADFGLSVAFHGGRSSTDNLEQLSERGTVRYMAGELIEGSLNLLDPMTSLLQTDVYAGALVLWELLWRCKDIWPPDEPPSYRVAYDNMVPRNPRLEHMYPVVVRDRRRPEMPAAIQKQKESSSTSGLVELWSFITDMWEHEPEGRTTAACTADRLRRLRQTMDPAGVETVP